MWRDNRWAHNNKAPVSMQTRAVQQMLEVPWGLLIGLVCTAEQFLVML